MDWCHHDVATLDWKAYVSAYPDLAGQIKTADVARHHWEHYGCHEKRTYYETHHRNLTFQIPMSEIHQKVRPIAIYFPQFHHIPENDMTWGAGWTDFTSLRSLPDTIDGRHIRKPDELGYYDLTNVETLQQQQKLAQEYGIYGFAIYHYWFPGYAHDPIGKVMSKPGELFLHESSLTMKFFFIWANESWSKKWMGSPHELTMVQKYGEKADWEIHYRYLREFFLSEKYIRIEGKPVIGIYRIFDIPILQEMVGVWNDLALQDGLSGVYILQCLGGTGGEKSLQISPSANGTYEYQPSLYIRLGEKSEQNFMGRRHHNNKVVLSYDDFDRQEIPSFGGLQVPGTFTGFNNTPRLYGKPCPILIVDEATPPTFDRSVQRIFQRAQSNHEPYAILAAWNEWGEGMTLEPDHLYKRQWIETVRTNLVTLFPPRIGLAITTYFTSKTPSKRLEIFQEGINSLLRTTFPGNIYVIDDGSTTKIHLIWIRSLIDSRLHIIERETNGGISKAKNTCLRMLMQDQCDIMFLADDDTIYTCQDWYTPYIGAINATGYEHWMFFEDDFVKMYPSFIKIPRVTNGYAYTQYNHHTGQLLILTRKVVDIIGYFKIFPAKYGYEHAHYTNRIVRANLAPGHIDILDSSKLLRGRNDAPSLTPEQVKNNVAINGEHYLENSIQFYDCIE